MVAQEVVQLSIQEVVRLSIQEVQPGIQDRQPEASRRSAEVRRSSAEVHRRSVEVRRCVSAASLIGRLGRGTSAEAIGDQGPSLGPPSANPRIRSDHGQRQAHQLPFDHRALEQISENGGAPLRRPLQSDKANSNLLHHLLESVGELDEFSSGKWESQLLALGYARSTTGGSLTSQTAKVERRPPRMSNDSLEDLVWHNIEASSVLDPVTGKRVREERRG